MAKGGARGKSSASSATRKKQAAKAAKKVANERDEDGNLLHPDAFEALQKAARPAQRGQKKDKTKSKDGKTKGKGKADKKKKQFIPPPKPPQPLPDPLDSMGLASLLPADLVVLLRKASKKDVVTRCRALEGILAWVEHALHPVGGQGAGEEDAEDGDAAAREALVVMLPCWVHLFPRLALSPTRRLRLLTTQIQALLLQSPPQVSTEDTHASVSSTRSELLQSPSYIEAMLGPWAILSYDIDRSIERIGRSTWTKGVTLRSAEELEQSQGEADVLPLQDYLDKLLEHVSLLLQSPSPSAALALTSAHAFGAAGEASSAAASGISTPVAAGARERDAKNRDDANVEEDTAALDKRLVAGALSVLSFIVTNHPQPKPVEQLESLLSSKLLWSSLSPSDILSGGRSQRNSTSSFGFDAPAVRARAWTLLRDLHASMPEILDRQIEVYGTVAMSAAWQERDVAVQRTMLDALLPILKARPSLWLVGFNKSEARAAGRKGNDADAHEAADDSEDEDDDEDEDEDDDDEEDDDDSSEESDERSGADKPADGDASSAPSSAPQPRPRSYIDFLRWIQTGCGGAPTLGYPTVLVFLSTLPRDALDTSSLDQSSEFLINLSSALYSRDLDSDPAGARAFLVSFCECTIFLCSRLYRDGADEYQRVIDAARLAERHFGLVWRELVLALAPPPDDKDQAENDGVDGLDTELESKARKARIKSMGDQRIGSELIGSIRKLYNIDQEGRLGAGIMASVKSDLLAIGDAASLTVLDPSSTSSAAEVLGSLNRAVGILAGLLLAPAAMSDAARASKVRSVAADTAQEILHQIATSFNQAAASAPNATSASTARLDAQSSLITSLVRALTTSGISIDQPTLAALEVAASQSLPLFTAQKSITASVASSFLAAYLPLCTDENVQLRVWNEVLGSIARLPTLADQVEALGELIAAAGAASHEDGLATLKEAKVATGLDDVVISLTTRLCDADADESMPRAQAKKVVSQLLVAPRPFIETAVAEQMLAVVTSTIEHLRYPAIDRAEADQSEYSAQERSRASKVLPDLLECLRSWTSAGDRDDKVRQLVNSPTSSGVVPAIFDLAYLSPASAAGSDSAEAVMHSASLPSFAAARSVALDLWQLLAATADEQVRTSVLRAGLDSGSEQLLDTKVPVDAIVAAAQQLSQDLSSDADPTSVLPAAKDLDAMLVRAARFNPSVALSILDPSVPQSEDEQTSDAGQTAHDAQGLGSYARSALALVRLLRHDRDLARQRQHSLHHAVFLALMAEDELVQPGSSRSCLSSRTSRPHLESIMSESVGVATAMLSSEAERIDAKWHVDLVAALQKKDAAYGTGLDRVLNNVWSLSRSQPESANLARLFGRLLSGCFSFGTITTAEAERWLKLGRSVADSANSLAQATILAAKPYVQDAQGYDRLRNELAANLAGTPPSKASTEGLNQLRLLVAAAPDIDADIPLIPQQRAIFLLQALQKWIASDEDIAEEINVRLAQLFASLVPIVQDMPGSHVDFFFDLVESNLDVASLSDDASLPGLYFTLRLLETLRDFALRNASLRTVWKERKEACLDLVRDRFLSLAEEANINDGADASMQTLASSEPKKLCAELIVDLVREVPSKSFEVASTAAPLCKLMVRSRVHDVQVVSYRLLSASIKDRVNDLVVETAVDKSLLTDGDNGSGPSLPSALLDNIADSLDLQLGQLVDDEAARQAAFGYFLSWIAVFDHFEDASLQLKSLFVAELDQRALVSDSLLPSVFALTGLVNEERRPFDPARWVVDEVFLDEIDPSPLVVIQVLATHVYFRALIHIPTLVRSWYLDIKDRQLSMLVSSFTTRNCTPLIATRELSHLREPDALSRLQDEAMAIKVLSTNEVVATYTVDEHPMEIGVRIPPDFPLHGVEIRDIKRVGVSEAQWRAWLLAVQQLITGRNGLIFDALSLFKRNAEVQFEGLEECAICYSIISPMDRSLPSKPCKTCKNKFHAGCLFKWISTSGSSTCPLCRSIL